MVELILMALGAWLLMLSYLLYRVAVEISKIKDGIDLAQMAVRISDEAMKMLKEEWHVHT